MRWLFLVLLTPGLLWGQSNDRRRVESQAFSKNESVANKAKNTWWRSGNFGLTPELSILGLGYDSNVYSRESDEIDDILGTPRVGLDTWYAPGPKWAWQNKAAYNYRYYVDQDGLREPEYNIESILHGMLRKAYVEAGARFFKDQGRQTSEQQLRIASSQRIIFANTVFQVTPRSHLIGDIDLFNISYDEPDGFGNYAALERDSRRITGKYLFKVNPRFWPYVGVKQETFDFKLNTNPREDAEFTGLLVGARNEKGERTHYSLELGSQDMSFDNAPQVEDTVLTVRALAEYSLSRVSSLAIGARQEPYFSLSQDYLFYVSSRVFVDWNYRFDRGTVLGLGLLTGTNSYDKPLQPVADDRDDDYRRVDADLKFSAGKLFDITLRAGFEKRDSNLEGLSHDGISVFADIKYKFQ